MQAPGPHEVLARDRLRFERLLLSRMGGSLSKEDAEDIVSEALIRAQLKLEDAPPEDGREQAWFARLVLNLGIDFLRARDGRRRDGVSPRPAVVPLNHIDEETNVLAPLGRVEQGDVDELGDEAERVQAQALVARVMATLDARDVGLVKLRHLIGPAASREQLAAMAGLTVGEFRWRYARAWRRFVDAIAADAPTERCGRIRRLMGQAEAVPAAAETVAEIDAHTLDCASCRVFARESYRALELMPFIPTVGIAERWANRLASYWDRSGQEATAGAGTAAAGAGLWGLLGGGSAAGILKAVAIVCSATVVTAGVCAGVVAVLDHPPKRPRAVARHDKRPKERRAMQTPAPIVVATPTPRPTAAPTAVSRKPLRRDTERAAAGTSGNVQIPASAPPGASEFNPGAASASNDPVPAPVAGGGEFSP